MPQQPVSGASRCAPIAVSRSALGLERARSRGVAVAVQQDPRSRAAAGSRPAGGGTRPDGTSAWRAASRPRRAGAASAARRGRRRRSSARGRRPGCRRGSRRAGTSSDALEVAPGEAEEAVVVERPPAAEPLARQRHLRSRRPRAPDRGDADLGWKWLVNVSGHRITRGPSRRPGRRAEPGAVNVVGSRTAAAAGARYARAAFASAASPGRLRQRVGEAGRTRGEPGPPVDQADRVGGARPQPALVVVGEELGLVVAMSTLTGQSLLQPLQDRQRSSASCTSSSASSVELARRSASRRAGAPGRASSASPRG